MANKRQRLIVLLTGVGITLVLAGMLPWMVMAQDATPEATPESIPQPEATEVVYDLGNVTEVVPTGDNSYCVVCHNQPLQTVTMRDGNILNLYVDPALITASVHGASSPIGTLGCIDCHGDNFPHSGPTPTDHREYTLVSVTFCLGCHEDQVLGLQNGLHERAILAGDAAAAVCTDCHGAHDIQPVSRFREVAASICGTCHTATLEEWQSSAHVDIGPLDCATCHSPHTQMMRGGLTTNQICLNCHEENMPEVFVHEQHSSTAYTVNCTDCHMFVPASAASVMTGEGVPTTTGHSMLVETVACNTCHQELVSTGEWTLIEGDSSVLREERAALQLQVEELTSQVAANENNYISLLQGLILGIGFGITGAAVFITRGNRRPEVTMQHDEEHKS